MSDEGKKYRGPDINPIMRGIIEKLQKERAENEQKKWEQESLRQYERNEKMK